MRPKGGMSSDDARKIWRYAVDTDFHAINAEGSVKEKTIKTFGTEDRFIPFDHPLKRSWYTHSINSTQNLLAMGDGSNIDIYDLDTGERRVLSGHSSDVNTVGFSPTNPNQLVSSSQGDMRRIGEALHQYEIIIWDLKSADRLDKADPIDIEGVTEAGVRAVIDGLCEKLKLEEEEEEEIRGSLRKMISSFENYHKIPAAARLTGRISTTFQSPLFSNSGEYLIYLPDSRPISNGDDTWDISLYRLADRKVVTLSGHRDSIMWIGFSPDDSLVASAGWDGSFRVHKISGEEVWRWETEKQNWAGVFSPDGLYFAGTDGEGIVRVWDLTTGQETSKHQFGPGWCRHINWSPNGRYLAVGAEDLGRVGMFSVVEGKLDLIQQRKLSLAKSSMGDLEHPMKHMMARFLSVHSTMFLKSRHGGQERTLLTHSTVTDEGVEVFDFDTGEAWRFVPGYDEDGKANIEESQDGRGALSSWLWREQLQEFGVITASGVRFWRL